MFRFVIELSELIQEAVPLMHKLAVGLRKGQPLLLQGKALLLQVGCLQGAHQPKHHDQSEH